MSRRFVVSAAKVDNHIIRSEPDLTLAMGRGWQPTFDPKTFEIEAARSFLEGICDFGSYSEVPPPDLWTYNKTISGLADSQPGNDGLPYSSYRYGGYRANLTLMRTDRHIREGALPPAWFNESAAIFIPKGAPSDPPPFPQKIRQ